MVPFFVLGAFRVVKLVKQGPMEEKKYIINTVGILSSVQPYALL